MKNTTRRDITAMKTDAAKKITKSATQDIQLTSMNNTGKDKSKVNFYKENCQNQAISIKEKRPKYLNILTRTEVSIIFKGRTRMIQVKQNYKNKYKDSTCRGCGQEQENQNHVLNECHGIHKDEQNKVSMEELFNNTLSKEQLQDLAKKLTYSEREINKHT